MLEPKADLWYGASATGKTSGIGELAELVAERDGRVTRLVTSDGGGIEGVKPHIDAGILQVWVIGKEEENPLEAWEFASQGYWPDPLKKVYTRTGLEAVGALALEGLTSAGDLAMAKLRKGKVKLSQDPSYVHKEGNTEFVGGNMTYFGFAQDRLYDWVMKSHAIPHVKYVIWTALETRGEEDGKPVYGPAIAGKKSIAKAPAWFRKTLHLDLAVTEKAKDANNQLQLETKRVIYLKPHADPTTRIIFPANPRVPLSLAASLPDFMAYEPGGMRKTYELLESLVDRDKQRLAALSKKIVAPPAVAGVAATKAVTQ